MRVLTDALYTRMADSVELTQLLGTFRGDPGIFTARPVPHDAPNPLVLAAETISDRNRDIVNVQGREIVRDIAVYGNAEGHYDAVESAAEMIRQLFHRQALDVLGFRVINVVASGPISGPADADEIAQIVTLTIRMDRVT